VSTLYEVKATKPINYKLIKTSNLFSHRNLSLLIGREHKNGVCVIVVDSAIYDLLVDEINSYYNHHKIEVTLIKIEGNEKKKTMDSYQEIVNVLDRTALHRRKEPIIALGGGVVMDIAGFVASTYRRSVPCIKIPTTLMGYVDAAIGIKNGVDHNGNKNRLGSFHEPHTVILDKGFLETLPHRHIVNGVAEILKIAIIKDKSLYDLIKTEGKASILSNFKLTGDEILDKSIIGLIKELESNLYEIELQRPSDFGHTFSPVIEMKNLELDMLHGEAVAIDIAISCTIAARRELISMESLTEIIELMKSLGLPTTHHSLTTELLMSGLEERILHRNGNQNVPVPSPVGECIFLQDISRDEISHALTYLR
jgi:3-dehydroquinate synthetase